VHSGLIEWHLEEWASWHKCKCVCTYASWTHVKIKFHVVFWCTY